MVALFFFLSTQMQNTKMGSSKLIIKLMLKSKWLKLVLDVNIMTLTTLNFNFFHIT